MGTKNQTIGQFILSYMEKQTGKTQFSIDEIFKAIKSDKDFEKQLNQISDAEYQYWGRDYLSSLFHNYSVRPKKPKIKRTHNKVYYYSLIK